MGTTTTNTDTITNDPFSLPIDLASSTAVPIGYLSSLRLYGFNANAGLSFPNSFNVTGTYTVQGPTQMFTQPFSIPFNRTTATPTHNPRWNGFVQVGSNYPDTARVGFIDVFPFYPSYAPANGTIFQGTVDGVQVTARFRGAGHAN
jgi:hypothetical protein